MDLREQDKPNFRQCSTDYNAIKEQQTPHSYSNDGTYGVFLSVGTILKNGYWCVIACLTVHRRLLRHGLYKWILLQMILLTLNHCRLWSLSNIMVHWYAMDNMQEFLCTVFPWCWTNAVSSYNGLTNTASAYLLETSHLLRGVLLQSEL